jgi:hypothetical protein
MEGKIEIPLQEYDGLRDRVSELEEEIFKLMEVRDTRLRDIMTILKDRKPLTADVERANDEGIVIMFVPEGVPIGIGILDNNFGQGEVSDIVERVKDMMFKYGNITNDAHALIAELRAYKSALLHAAMELKQDEMAIEFYKSMDDIYNSKARPAVKLKRIKKLVAPTLDATIEAMKSVGSDILDESAKLPVHQRLVKHIERMKKFQDEKANVEPVMEKKPYDDDLPL